MEFLEYLSSISQFTILRHTRFYPSSTQSEQTNTHTHSLTPVRYYIIIKLLMYYNSTTFTEIVSINCCSLWNQRHQILRFQENHHIRNTFSDIIRIQNETANETEERKRVVKYEKWKRLKMNMQCEAVNSTRNINKFQFNFRIYATKQNKQWQCRQ